MEFFMCIEKYMSDRFPGRDIGSTYPSLEIIPDFFENKIVSVTFRLRYIIVEDGMPQFYECTQSVPKELLDMAVNPMGIIKINLDRLFDKMDAHYADVH